MQATQVILYIVWAGSLYQRLLRKGTDAVTGFSGLRIHAISLGNWAITAVVVLLAAVPAFTNVVSVSYV